MEKHVLPSVIILLAFGLRLGADGDPGLLVSEFCLPLNQSCPLNLACPAGGKIVILEEQRGFGYNGTGSLDTCGTACRSACCRQSNFRCLHPATGLTFSHTFTICWHKEQCRYQPAGETRVFANHSSCSSSSGPSLLGALKYKCINASAVRDFRDPSPVSGHLLMASFSPSSSSSSSASPPCVRPNSTLECLVESAEDGSGAVQDVRMMLVMNYSSPGSCSKLQFVVGRYRSGEMPCRSAVEHVAVQQSALPIRLSLTLQQGGLRDEAWAVFDSARRMKMTCGRTCPATPSTVTATPSTSAAVSSEPQSSPAPSPAPSPGAGSGQTDSGAAGGEGSLPLVPVLVSLVLLALLLVAALLLVLLLLLRLRRLRLRGSSSSSSSSSQPEATYASRLPAPPEEDRPYASLQPAVSPPDPPSQHLQYQNM